MEHPVHFHYSGMAPSRAAEAAAQRRIRALESAHPAVLAWTVRLEGPMARVAAGADCVASVEAALGHGEVLRAHARAADALGALRVALNTLEERLDEAREGSRARAAQWLQAVRSRLGHGSSFV